MRRMALRVCEDVEVLRCGEGSCFGGIFCGVKDVLLMVLQWCLQVFVVMISLFTAPMALCQKPLVGMRVSNGHAEVCLD